MDRKKERLKLQIMEIPISFKVSTSNNGDVDNRCKRDWYLHYLKFQPHFLPVHEVFWY
jgi:hypothetical protein